MLLVAAAGSAGGATITVSEGQNVQAAIDRAATGDVLRLGPGRHDGPLRVNKTLDLEGEPGAVVIGSGHGSVVTVSAPGATVRGLTVRDSGDDLEAMDAGIFVEKSATGAVLEGNQLEGYTASICMAPKTRWRAATGSWACGNVASTRRVTAYRFGTRPGRESKTTT